LNIASKFEKLRQLSRKDASHLDHLDWNIQIAAETNDRGACLLLSANVEAALDAAIEQILAPRRELPSEMHREDGPLANFSRKIAMGSVLRIYCEKTKANLTIIRHVRNAFAHAKIRDNN
jgi:hypothetical protein